jgi:agmatinase
MVDSNETLEKINPGNVAILGIPYDENSSFLKGPALAPPKIREALYCESSNLSTERKINIEIGNRIHDLGDIDVHSFIDDIELPVSNILEKDAFIISLGGDHSITYPIIKAYGAKYQNLNILQLDAHPDLYHQFEENPNSNASPFARIMENKLANRLVQVGIRTMNPHQHQQATRFNVETIDMKSWDTSAIPVFEGPLYISLDIDVLDPAFAPGVSHHEPGGLSTREVLRIIQTLPANIVGADIVELNPQRDPQGITAMAAAKLLKEILDKMM